MFMRESSCWTRFERSNRSKGTGSFLDRIFISDSNEETPKEMEVTVHDNENATGFYRLSTGQAAYFENIKPHNQSKEDWCIPEDMEECDYLMMDPACEVNEKGTREKNNENEGLEEGTSPPLDLDPCETIEADEETLPYAEED